MASESEAIPTRPSSPDASSIGAAHNAVDPVKNTAVNAPKDSKSKLQHLVDEKDSSANKLHALGEKIDFHEGALKKWQDKMNTAFEAHRKINKRGKNRGEEFKKSREIYAPIMHLSSITKKELVPLKREQTDLANIALLQVRAIKMEQSGIESVGSII
jgi:hypothetical protein